MTVKYISFSIIIDDIVFPDGRTQMGVLGGGGAQTVWGMAVANGAGAEVGVMGGVGSDMPADLLAPLQAVDVNLTGVHETQLPTPRAWELLEEDERRTHVWRTDPKDYFGTQIGLIWEKVMAFYPHVEVAHWGIHPKTPNLSLCAPLRERGALVSIEPFKGTTSPLPDDTLRAILSQCDIFSPNWQEAVSIFGTTDKAAMIARCQEFGGHILALRLGDNGSEVWDVRAGVSVQVSAAPVQELVDPVGAGNAYCGAFALTYHQTGDLKEAAINASTAASYLVEQIGLPLVPPTRDDYQTRQQAVRATAKKLSR